MRRRLHNDDWGYETNCFVCEQKNADGLQIPFFHDDELDVVEAEFRLDDRHSGAPTIVHGGLQLAVLDEAMAWAVIAIAGKWALTSTSSARFLAVVHTDVDHRVLARVTEVTPSAISTSAEILIDGEVATSAEATFVPVGDAFAVRVAGEVADEHRSFLRDDP